jgi:hypothetical protein
VATGERRLRILTRLVDGGPEFPTNRLCEVCAEITGMNGAGIMLMSGDVPRGSVCTTNEVSELIEQLQDALGEGPCVDAYEEDRPVLEPDLRDPKLLRWPAFTGPVLDAGARAVFGFPLRVGAVRLGALNLYSERAGSLNDEQHSDALVVADVAAHTVILLQANAPPGRLAAALEEGADFQHVVHQAAGMVAVQLGIGVGEALVRLRAYAFGHDRRLTEVAEAVVARTLRFEAQHAGTDEA